MADFRKRPTERQPQRIGVREFRGNLSAFLREASQGRTFLVTSHDEVLAEIRPPPANQQPRRQPGALSGRIWMAPDFDELPSEMLDAIEGEPD